MAEYSDEFDRLWKNRVAVSYHKYGPAQKNFGEGRVDALATAQLCLDACSARSNSRGSRHTPGSPQQARRDAHSRPRPSGHTAGFPGIDIRPAAGPQPLGVSSAESCTRPTWCPPCVGSAFWHRAITSRQNKRAQADMNALALHTAQAHWLRLKSIFRYCSRLQCRQKTKALTLPSGGSRSNFIARQEGHITHPSFMLSLPCSFWFFNTYHRLF
jgi:hypothetical protein